MQNVSKWERIETGFGEADRLYSKPRSFAGEGWFRFRHKATSLIGLILIVLLLLFAIVGPFLTPYGYDDQNTKLANIPPLMKVCPMPNGHYFYVSPALKVIELDEEGHLLQALRKGKDNPEEKITVFPYGDSTVTLDYTELPAAIRDEDGNRITNLKRIWNRSYLLGTDHLGRDILSRLMYGTRISLMVAFIAALVNMVIGTFYGGISGYLGGKTDSVMMRIVDIISTIPLTLYVILIKVCLDNGLLSIIIALSSVYWVDMARVVRGQVLSLKNQEFVMAARTIGSSTRSILVQHLIPNAMGPILVTVTMLIPSAIFMEAFMFARIRTVRNP